MKPLTFLIFALLTHQALSSSLTIQLGDQTISVSTNYIWTIELDQAVGLQQITLHFPVSASLDTVVDSDISCLSNCSDTITPAIHTNNNTIVMTSNFSNETTIQIEVRNVINAPYYHKGNIAVTTNMGDNLQGDIIFQTGAIIGCSISFDGFTWQQSSTAYLEFIASSSIQTGAVRFEIGYSSYSYPGSLSIKDNNNIDCSFSIDSIEEGSTVRAVVDTEKIQCQFPSASISANQAIILRLENVRNPPTTTDYSVFTLQTHDQSYLYDTGSCQNSQVAIRSFSGQFSNIDPQIQINYQYSTPLIVTDNSVNIKINAGDTLQIQHTGQGIMDISCLSNQILLLRGSDNIESVFTINSQFGNQTISATNGNQNDNSGQISINLFDNAACTITMPRYASSIQMYFMFLNLNRKYMQIQTTIDVQAAIIPNGAVSLAVDDSKIGATTTYHFTIDNQRHQLGTSSMVLIDLPLQIGLQSFIMNVCTMTIATELTTDCYIDDSVNKIITVLLSNSVQIDSSITISIPNLGNPNTPGTAYSDFWIYTYYDSSINTSLVEYGDTYISQQYIKRQAQVNVTTGYTVYKYPSYLTVTYINTVNLPNNIDIVIELAGTFASSLQFGYDSFLVDNTGYTLSPTPLNDNGTFTIRFSQFQIPAGSQISINFVFRSPSSVGTFPILDLTSMLDGVDYQYTISTLQIEVDTPALQDFVVTSNSYVTGASAQYQFFFYTNIIHEQPFALEVTIPEDIQFSTGAVCSGSCTAILEQTTQKFTVSIQNSDGQSNRFTILVNNFKNPRQIGDTGQFQLRTLTELNGQQILHGNSTFKILKTNQITAYFNPDDQYYKKNQSPVKIEVSVTNQIETGDYFLVVLDYRTYTLLNDDASGLACTLQNVCTYDVESSTSSVTVIKIVPDSTGLDFSFTIDGLLSSSTTHYTQTFDVEIRSVSSNGNLMDKGTFLYSISCGDLSHLECETCDTTQCLSCYDWLGFYVFEGQCVTNCANRSQYESFPDSNSSKCISCLSPCLTCVSASQCLTCESSYFLYEDLSCLTVCSDGYYQESGSNNQKLCNRCWDWNCQKCTDGSSDSCQVCSNLTIFSNGRCVTSCSFSAYNNQGICQSCDSRCQNCSGPTNRECYACKSGYYNISGQCIDQCDDGTVIVGSQCTCTDPCLSCVSIPTRCQSCSNSSYVLYNYQCLSQCPYSTFLDGSDCLDCQVGCLNCTKTTCYQCLDGYNIYENQCVTQCNNIADRYAAVNGMCLECPQGCDVCDQSYACSVCLENYTLVGTQCIQTCVVNDNCEVEPTEVVPLAGSIAIGIWLVLIIVLKLAVIPKLYVPYAYMYLGCLVEIILVIIITSQTNDIVQTVSSRVLQEITAEDYHYAVLGILIVSIGMNYTSNFVYVYMFCRYLKVNIPDRQIDKITNYVVLILGTLSNYRFSLLAYSKMFPKPNIITQNASKLTPLHYLCIGSVFIDILPLSAAGILIYNQQALSALFMLALDLLVILLLNLIFSIWVVSVQKPDDYFEDTKKYQIQQNYQTDEGLNQKDKNVSHLKLTNAYDNYNSVVHVEDIQSPIKSYAFPAGGGIGPVFSKDLGQSQLPESFTNNHRQIQKAQLHLKSDNENQPLPIRPIKVSQINLETIKVLPEDANEQKGEGQIDVAKRKKKGNKTKQNRLIFNDSKQRKVMAQEIDDSSGLEGKINESPKNYSKEKNIKENRKIKVMNIKQLRHQESSNVKNTIEEFEDDGIVRQVKDDLISEPGLKQTNSFSVQKNKKMVKPHTQRSAILKTSSPMKKKEGLVFFQSEAGESAIDEVDLDAIIKTKMIDKTNQAKKRNQVNSQQAGQEVNHQQISPSWFNIQNQRYDGEESSDFS